MRKIVRQKDRFEKLLLFYIIVTLCSAVLFMFKEYINVFYNVFIKNYQTEYGPVPIHIKTVLTFGWGIFISLIYYLVHVSAGFIKSINFKKPLSIQPHYLFHHSSVK